MASKVHDSNISKDDKETNLTTPYFLIGEHNDDHCITLYDSWCTKLSELVDEVNRKNATIKRAEENMKSAQKTVLRLQEECSQLQRSQDICHHQLKILCGLEDNIRNMSSKLALKEQELADKTAQNKTDVQDMKDFLKREYEEKLVKIKSECNEKVNNLEVLLHEAQEANATLETQLKNTLKEKDREITRISMEYDSRLALSERQKVQLMQQQQQVLNQDVLRKKMQHMKETYEKELVSLRTQLSELQSCQQQRADCRQLQHQWQNQSHDMSPRPGGHRSRPNSKGRSLSMSKHTF